ncbi:mannose-P-dolichol utilization defect 1 protein homolog [Argonauta hians]
MATNDISMFGHEDSTASIIDTSTTSSGDNNIVSWHQYHFYVISMLISLGCLFIKLPQINNILQSKQTKSISMKAVITECLGHSIGLVYHVAMSYPLSSYSEYLVLVPQDLVLLCVLVYYNNMFDARVATAFTVYVLTCVLLMSGVISPVILKAAILLSTPISLFSKSLQIRLLYKSKNVGQLSLTSWCVTTGCSTARLLTSIYETGDGIIVVNLFSGILLNIVIILQIVYYNRLNRKVKLP